jgi:hypothetical protein
MDDPRAQRTLVKSPPELWAEISDVGALARHLGAFGEIRITRLEPETTVAWEGDRARGTVELEPSGWGTKVTLTARIEAGPQPAGDAARDRQHGAQTGAEAMATPEPEVVANPQETPEAEALADPATVSPVAEPRAKAESDATAEPAPPPPVAEPQATPEPRSARRRGLLARLFGHRRHQVAPLEALEPEGEPERPPDSETERALGAAVERAPGPAAEPAPDPAAGAEPSVSDEPAPLDAGRAEEILVGVLDDLGAARHRPFSRG